ncbi:hypothetical protein GSI_09494 [Ganoderma sinense ZZ0214-1]|uniref:Uncharacterized protein n=1 Tax=Ganoderma sinense ZZ0214-1 TaxID=1077348 RepID=A0A2G8S3I5_9APHY|nr:hypothetical protein GSI_09494 [Ganoderma sinense ZZ0214-1]
MNQLSPDGARSGARVSFAGLRQTAAILRRALPQPDLGLWLLQRETIGARWRLFRPIVNEDLDVELYLREEFDPAAGQGILVYGLD